MPGRDTHMPPNPRTRLATDDILSEPVQPIRVPLRWMLKSVSVSGRLAIATVIVPLAVG